MRTISLRHIAKVFFVIVLMSFAILLDCHSVSYADTYRTGDFSFEDKDEMQLKCLVTGGNSTDISFYTSSLDGFNYKLCASSASVASVDIFVLDSEGNEVYRFFGIEGEPVDYEMTSLRKESEYHISLSNNSSEDSEVSLKMVRVPTAPAKPIISNCFKSKNKIILKWGKSDSLTSMLFSIKKPGQRSGNPSTQSKVNVQSKA